jgi:peptide/nickel transport system permease protein
MIEEESIATTATGNYYASQWRLMWMKFKDHKLALTSLAVLGLFYTIALLGPFLAPYDSWQPSSLPFAPPTRVHFLQKGYLGRPVVYGAKMTTDPQTFRRSIVPDQTKILPVRFFVRGPQYKWLRLIRTDWHLFGVDAGGQINLLGTDILGRDCFSRDLIATQISVTVGIVGVLVTFVLGVLIGGVSGYYGGVVDNVIQRFLEFVTCVPTIPMWMALSAAIPSQWSDVKVYFAITIILALRSWTGLSRQVRSKLLQSRNEEYVVAATVAGASDARIILTHLLPGFASYLIVSLTLEVPRMILGETTLSFFGLGLRPPTVSWGVLLQDAQNLAAISSYPWLTFPAVMVVVCVLAFNFLGDGLRDAADPYKE